MDIESDGAVVDVSDITAFSNGSRRRSCRIRVPSQRLSESRENDITQRERRRHNRERLLNSRIASAQQRLLRTDNGGAVLLNATNLRLKEANNFINSDAKKYARALETLSRFVLCGICGTEDSCKMMFSMAKATQLIKECLPLKNAYKKLSREKSEFAKCVKQDFTKYGILVNAEHLCKYCFNKLRCNSKSMNSSKSVHSFMIEDETDESGKS